MRLLRAVDRAATPWKNGGGVTTEVAAFPPGATLEDFGWRVSIAEVRRGGPFSVFAGIDRHLAVLAGRLDLRVEGRAPIELSPASPPVDFPGDAATSAEPLDAPVVDLNVMTRRGQFVARMIRHASSSSSTITLDGNLSLLIALSNVSVERGSRAHALSERDAVMLQEPGVVVVTPRAASAAVITIEIARA